MGLGQFGGGVGAVNFLLERGARVTLTDLRPKGELADSLKQIDARKLQTLRLGEHRVEDFRNADFIVANPAVPPENPYLQIARRAGVPVTTEMNLFWQANPAPVIGVTGSNGKSTTAAMIDSMLRAAGQRCWLGGNIGRSLLPVVDRIGPHDRVVLELSSFQLAGLDEVGASPHIAVVTNFSPNHLDWHGSIDAYRLSKQTILKWQQTQDVAVFSQDDDDVSRWPSRAARLWFGMSDRERDGAFEDGEHIIVRMRGGEEIVRCADWSTPPGVHNRRNALAAACAALAAGADVSAITQGLLSFQPLPHRLQFVAEIDGRSFYNDSLATTPESAIAALEAFDAPIVLLAGGYDKQVDLSAFAASIARKVKAVALMGQTAERLARQIETSGVSPAIPMSRADSLEESLAWARRKSAPGDVVLLSPGCASYDWFSNFAERGDRFAKLVLARRAA